MIAPPAPTLTLTITGPVHCAEARNSSMRRASPGTAGGDYDRRRGAAISIVTVGGTVSSPQNLALRINNKFYTYAVQTRRHARQHRSGAWRARGGRMSPERRSPAPAITIGPTGRLQAARVGGFGTIAKEVRRQERVMMITVWANAPALRDQIAAAVDVALARDTVSHACRTASGRG